MNTDKIALEVMIASLKNARAASQMSSIGWEIDDEITTLIEHAEHALGELEE